jgi:hypothetical protein
MANTIVKNIFTTISTTVATGAAISIGILFNVKVEAALIQQGLFFGRDIPGGGEVSETDFETFLNNVITPRFPDGLTVYDANGQFKNSTGTIIKEKSKYVTIFAEDNSINNASIYDIGQAYLKQFNQESVLQVTNKNVKVSFGVGDLFSNPPTNSFIKTDLFFGRNIPGGGEVSETDFQTFINNVVTPSFPDGLTVFDANGQFKNSTGTIIKEKSKNLSLFFEDTLKNQASIYDIVNKYTNQFNQESVLQVADEDVKVSFGVGDLFNNPPTNSFIKTDLFFGRNIPGGGEVSETDFQTFINNIVTPSFPDGLTVFDANGQFKNSTGTIIKEKSKNLSLFFEDTLKNQASIYDIVNKYTQQFNQESVLQVLDESLDVTFITAPKPTSVPEPALMWGLTALGVLGAGSALKKKVVRAKHQDGYVSAAKSILDVQE